MDWHSTRSREELLILLAGQVDLEAERPRPRASPAQRRGASRGRLRRVALRAGQCAFLPKRTLHRVINRSSADARYLYVAA